MSRTGSHEQMCSVATLYKKIYAEDEDIQEQIKLREMEELKRNLKRISPEFIEETVRFIFTNKNFMHDLRVYELNNQH